VQQQLDFLTSNVFFLKTHVKRTLCSELYVHMATVFTLGTIITMSQRFLLAMKFEFKLMLIGWVNLNFQEVYLIESYLLSNSHWTTHTHFLYFFSFALCWNSLGVPSYLQRYFLSKTLIYYSCNHMLIKIMIYHTIYFSSDKSFYIFCGWICMYSYWTLVGINMFEICLYLSSMQNLYFSLTSMCIKKKLIY